MFLTPWVVEKRDPKYTASVKSKNAIPGKDGDLKVVREALDVASTTKVELDNSSSNNLDELEGNFKEDG